jgi:hypothetical protein
LQEVQGQWLGAEHEPGVRVTGDISLKTPADARALAADLLGTADDWEAITG